MGWAAVDDRLHAHPKVRRLQRLGSSGAAALGVWAWLLSWCKAYAPESGRFDLDTVSMDWGEELGDESTALLVRVRLVDVIVDEEDPHVTIGYVIHDWPDWQNHTKDAGRQLGGKRRAESARRDRGRFAPKHE